MSYYNDMSVLIAEGNVTADLEVKVGAKSGKKYICFNLANNKGTKEAQRPSFYQCWVFGDENCQQMVDAKVKRGTRLKIVGELEVTPFQKEDGTKTITPKVSVYSWGFASGGRKPDDSSEDSAANTNAAPAAPDTLPENVTGTGTADIDCGDDGLPDNF